MTDDCGYVGSRTLIDLELLASPEVEAVAMATPVSNCRAAVFGPQSGSPGRTRVGAEQLAELLRAPAREY